MSIFIDMGCLILIDYSPQKSPLISGSFAERDVQRDSRCHTLEHARTVYHSARVYVNDYIHIHTHTHAHTHTYIGADAVFIGCDDVVQARTVRKLVELGADLNASTSLGWCV